MRGTVLDFKTAWDDQKDLDILCASRAAEGCVETYWPNNNYGNARVLKEYMGWPMSKPLPIMVPHGVYVNDLYIFPGEELAPVPAVFATPDFVAKLWRRRSRKKVIDGTSPFLYALKMMPPDLTEEARGTIFYPGHGTKLMPIDTDPAELAEHLLALPEEFHPISISVHWNDYLQGFHREFKKRGFRILSAGHMNDFEFNYRWTHLLRAHRYAGGNDLNSSIFYALAARKPVFITGKKPNVEIDMKRYPTFTWPSPQMQSTLNDIGARFRRPGIPSLGITEQAIADYFLGAENLKSPEDLKQQLEQIQ